MKKSLSLLLAICMIYVFAACGASAAEVKETAAPETAAPETIVPETTETSNLKLGLYIGTAQSGADATADADGKAQTDSTIAAVLVDEDGVIVGCILDIAQTKIAFTAAGEVLNKDAEVLTKRQLGDDYGMSAAATKGEWYVQAQGFCDYVIGKTAAEIQGIAVDDTGHATDEALLATTTVKVGGYIDAVLNACNAAEDLGSQSGDKLGLGVSTTISGSTDATAEADGTCYAYTHYCAVTVNADQQVTAAIVDATQSKISINTEGAITTDLEASEVVSKDVIRDNYGLAAASGIGLEWYQQAAGFCSYIIGMTADDISGIAIDETGHAADEALLATTTVHISDFVKVASSAIGDGISR
ncbi:MAG: hypothetical protein EOM54_00745 [Clostridia bacterium]|nr:hypothetical protein [Clostridia bacterium]